MVQENLTQKIQAPKVRSSNLEFYRIISMILIIAHHYVVNSGLTSANGPVYSDPLSWRSIFLLLFGAWGKTGINCFVLITGYFMCKSQITVKKFVKLLGEIMFYRIVISAIFWITGYAEFSIVECIKTLIPITSIDTGFTSTYLVFFLCIPFLNVLVNAMTEKQHIKLLLICSFTYIFLGTVPKFSVTMNYVSWFIVLYFISSYIRLYPKRIFSNTKVWGWLTLTTLFVSAISVVACVWLGTKLNRNMAFEFVTDSNTFLAVALGLFSFMFFKNIKMKNNKFVNAVASTMFGVLLIHANSATMRAWLWGDLLDNVGIYDSNWMPLHAIGSVVAIFIVCSAIDFLRIKFVEIPFFKLWDKKWDKVAKKYYDFENKICKKLDIEEQ